MGVPLEHCSFSSVEKRPREVSFGHGKVRDGWAGVCGLWLADATQT